MKITITLKIKDHEFELTTDELKELQKRLNALLGSPSPSIGDMFGKPDRHPAGTSPWPTAQPPYIKTPLPAFPGPFYWCKL